MRCLMMLTVVAVIFGIFTVGLIVLLIYKSTLTMHRDDQLFLDDASSHMHDEQTELLTKLNRLTIPSVSDPGYFCWYSRACGSTRA